jgi:hypothetical protein
LSSPNRKLSRRCPAPSASISRCWTPDFPCVLQSNFFGGFKGIRIERAGSYVIVPTREAVYQGQSPNALDPFSGGSSAKRAASFRYTTLADRQLRAPHLRKAMALRTRHYPLDRITDRAEPPPLSCRSGFDAGGTHSQTAVAGRSSVHANIALRIYETNVGECNSARRVARGHGGWPEAL